MPYKRYTVKWKALYDKEIFQTLCVLYLREPMGTDIPNSWNTSFAMVW